MEDKGASGSHLVISVEKSESLYPIYLGVSCAFFALRLLPEPDKKNEKWTELSDKLLQASAQLLGLLVWRVQRGSDGEKSQLLHKLVTAEKEIEELKERRREDAKANERVVGIFASQEQCWLTERKRLRQQVGILMNGMRVLEKKKDEEISESREKLKEMELLVQSKDKVIEEEEKKRKDLEEKLKETEKHIEELRETAKRAAQEHSTELWKHKTAFIELVSNQRQLEADMGRAFRQVEAKKQELETILEQKEESVLFAQKLSAEIIKMRKDLEQKDKVLSALLRKFKLDTTEKQMLLKEVKLSKAKRKQAEQEIERWRAVTEARDERHSLRSYFMKQANSRVNASSGERGTSHGGKSRMEPTDLALEYEHPDSKRDMEIFSYLSDYYSPDGNEELADTKRLEGLVRLEAEKYAAVLEKRHHLELDAFAEQMRLKDEKLEAFRWRMLSMELESKRLQSRAEGLNQDISQLRHDNMKLKTLLMDQEEELISLKDQLKSQLKPPSFQTTNISSSIHDPALTHDTIWSKVDVVKTKENKEQQAKTDNEEEEETLYQNDANVTVQPPEKELEGVKQVSRQSSIHEDIATPAEVDIIEKLASPVQPLDKTTVSSWRADLNALGVSYKIKRIKQQLLMLERLTGKQESGPDTENNNEGMKGFLLLISLLNKQVSRYHSLQGKTDELCKRMHEKDQDMNQADSSNARKKVETKTLEHFLEETFQLQRYTVATGQKLMEFQNKIASGFVGLAEELGESVSFDTNRFADNIKTLFQEVQRGLEVRIARIIGDLEGTLACEGMVHLRR